MGLGRFGGGLAVSRHLINSGADLIITDTASPNELADSLRELEQSTAKDAFAIIHGEHDISILNEADLLVVNPAVPQPWNNPFIQAAQSKGIPVTTEIEIAYQHINPAQVIAVTGSAGKSTTSAMIHHILSATGHHSILGGNIGDSILNHLHFITPDTALVLELSSAMLYWLWGQPAGSSLQRPAIRCITNCTPNHLDWHGSTKHYIDSKKLLIPFTQLKTQLRNNLILSESLTDWAQGNQSDLTVIRSTDAVSDCHLQGSHNAMNAAMAIAAVHAFDQNDSSDSANIQQYMESVRAFTGLPHRLNLCHQSGGVSFYNDSKSTIPQATLLAVAAIQERTPTNQIHLICGGYDKGSDLSQLSDLSAQLAGLYCIGMTGKAIAGSARINAYDCKTLAQAVQHIFERIKPGDAVVLSPGCASWDQFSNYEERGESFTSLVQQYTKSVV